MSISGLNRDIVWQNPDGHVALEAGVENTPLNPQCPWGKHICVCYSWLITSRMKMCLGIKLKSYWKDAFPLFLLIIIYDIKITLKKVKYCTETIMLLDVQTSIPTGNQLWLNVVRGWCHGNGMHKPVNQPTYKRNSSTFEALWEVCFPDTYTCVCRLTRKPPPAAA